MGMVHGGRLVARALKAERLGDNVTAAIHLDEAIASESQS